MCSSDLLDKKYYKIREVSEIIGVPPSTLRFWEKQFPSISPKRNSGRTRYYTPGDIERIQMIHYLLKDKGLKIEAAQEVLAKNPHGVSKRAKVLERLRLVRDELQSMLDAIDDRRRRHGRP